MRRGPADAIVVGAGPVGSWAAKELCERGLRVQLLDAGPVLPTESFRVTGVTRDLFSPRYQLFRLKLLVRGDRERGLDKFVSQETARLFADRREHPYAADGDGFSWTRIRAVGGRGHLWGRVMLRYTAADLADGPAPWPVAADALTPYYDEVEELMELGGAPSGTPLVPDGRYVRERSLNDLEAAFRRGAAVRWPDRPVVVNHVAEYPPGPWSPMLEAASRTGNLEVLPCTVARRLVFDAGGAVSGVETREADGSVGSRLAGHVVLAASPFESVRILLATTSPRTGRSLGDAEGLLGTRVLEHMVTGFMSQLPDAARRRAEGVVHNPFRLNEEPHGFYIPAPERGPGERFGVQGTMSPATGLCYVGAFGEAEPVDANRLTLDGGTDAAGAPTVRISYRWSPADLELWRAETLAVADLLESFQQESGIRLDQRLTTRVYNHLAAAGPPTPGSNHESGGARMGDDARSGVVDPLGRMWEAQNVVVADAAVFPCLPPPNPTLTAMALAVRACRYLATGSLEPAATEPQAG